MANTFAGQLRIKRIPKLARRDKLNERANLNVIAMMK